MRQIDSILGTHGEIRAPMRRFSVRRMLLTQLIGRSPIITDTARILRELWDSLALITEEVLAGVSDRMLVLDENDELEGMESSCDYSISQNASNGSEGFRE
jgi:hypothetical protein